MNRCAIPRLRAIILWCAVCFKIISCHWGNGEKYRLDFATKIAKYRLDFCDQNRKISTRFFDKNQLDSLPRNRLDLSTRVFAQKSIRYFDKNQPDSLSRNPFDFSTKINPILCPEIDSNFRQKSTRFFVQKSFHRLPRLCTILSVSLGVRVQVHCVE